MSIKFSKVMIHNVDVTCGVSSIYETKQGYRVCFQDGGCSFNKDDVNIFEIENHFDISKHEFSDSDACIDYLDASKDKLVIETSIHAPIFLSKRDALVIAKSLGVTAKDLG